MIKIRKDGMIYIGNDDTLSIDIHIILPVIIIGLLSYAPLLLHITIFILVQLILIVSINLFHSFYKRIEKDYKELESQLSMEEKLELMPVFDYIIKKEHKTTAELVSFFNTIEKYPQYKKHLGYLEYKIKNSKGDI